MTRARQARLLARPLLRTVPLLPILVGGALGGVVLTLDGPLLFRLRVAALALATGAAFALDDAAAVTTAASPTPLVYRRLLRVVLVVAPVAVLWTGLTRYAGAPVLAAVTLELAAMLAIALAAAAIAGARLPDRHAGLAAAPVLLGLVAVAAVALPAGWTLFAHGPADPHWGASHARWAALLGLALLVLAYTSLDPVRRQPRPRRAVRPREPISLADPTDPA